MAECRILAMPWPEILCACGWRRKIEDTRGWGVRAGHDWLLDQHAAHVAAKRKA